MSLPDLCAPLRLAADVTPSTVLQAVEHAAYGLRMAAVQRGPNHLELKRGSGMNTRLLGGAFVPVDDLPIGATVRALQTPGDTQVDITVRDTLGFGFRTGMKKRLQVAMAEVMTGLRAAVERCSEPGRSPPGWYPDPSGPARLRYWDGAGWTTHVAPATSGEPLGPPDP